MNFPSKLPHAWVLTVLAALVLSMAAGVLARGYWTPDEPREADLAWRMSWQRDKAVPLLAGEPFCEKPPLSYWISGATMAWLGDAAWAARLPNLLYALLAALAVGALGRRAAGPIAGVAAAAALSTFLLTYQVLIWLATDAALLASVSVALWGLFRGFYAEGTRERLFGYTSMHAALAVGFLAKSAAAWMVPSLGFVTLIAWERRWRELLRFEPYAGLVLQALIIGPWIAAVYHGPHGVDHLKVFFWNNLAGRMTAIDAPEALQYTAGHRNTPGKYLWELLLYLWPWTLLVAAAVRRAWLSRGADRRRTRLTRFATATFVPTFLVLSVAATARNIYLAPALPAAALLLADWVADPRAGIDAWDRRALRSTALLLLAAVAAFSSAVALVGYDAWEGMDHRAVFLTVSVTGLAVASAFALDAMRAARDGGRPRAALGLLLAYCTLLIAPAPQLYREVDAWQDLESIGRHIGRDSAGRPLILFRPDETTRAFIDMYARTSAVAILSSPPAANARLLAALAETPSSVVVAMLPGRGPSRAVEELERLGRRLGLRQRRGDDPFPPAWAAAAGLEVAHVYALPNGRRYALLARPGADTSR